MSQISEEHEQQSDMASLATSNANAKGRQLQAQRGLEGFTPGPWRYSEVWRPPIARVPIEGERRDGLGNVFYGYSISGSSEGGAHILPTLGAVHNFPDNCEANARLIAAAPDLLEALQQALEMRQFICEAAYSRSYEDGPSIQSCWSEVDGIEAIIRAAIARATGAS